MKPIVGSVVILGNLALMGSAVFAAEPTPPYTGPWPGWHGPWTGIWWICPMMLLFMFVFFALACFAFRRRRGDWGPWRWMGGYPEARGEDGRETALEILNKRYAHGEIDKEEYAEIKTAIVSDEQPTRGAER